MKDLVDALRLIKYTFWIVLTAVVLALVIAVWATKDVQGQGPIWLPIVRAAGEQVSNCLDCHHQAQPPEPEYNQPPVAMNDSPTCVEYEWQEVPLMDNDWDPDGQELRYASSDYFPSSHGYDVAVSPDRLHFYVRTVHAYCSPTVQWSFQYAITDGFWIAMAGFSFWCPENPRCAEGAAPAVPTEAPTTTPTPQPTETPVPVAPQGR